MTQRFDCSDDEQRRVGIAAAAAAIRDGHLVIVPTDTVYGIAADAFTPNAIAGLLAAKGRGRDMPVPVLIADIDTLEGVATNVDSTARLLTRACWPGGLTLIVEHPPSLAWDLGAAGGTVAVRVPDDDVARDLLRETGPLGVSSANISGRPPASTADEAIEQLGALVAVVLDDGPRAAGEASTIVDCTVDPPRVVRAGAIPESRLQYLVPTLRTVASESHPSATSSSQPSQGATAGMSEQSSTSTYWGPDFDSLSEVDPEIADVILGELGRLRGGLQLIASENFTSPAVLAALGSTLSNKYAEGYPGRRYYGGCAEVDKAEEIGIARAKELFGADHANLQPHSGATANLAAYGAFMSPGDTLLGMALPHGGHLTHGAKVSFSGKWFNAKHYGVSKQTEHIDYDEVRDLAREHRPKVIVCGGSAIPRTIDFALFREIADEVGAILIVDAAHFVGLVAGQAIPSPVPYADVVTFTTHKVLRGPRGGAIVCKAEHAKAIDKAVFPMMQGGPQMHSVAAKAVNLKECQSPAYQAYARQVITNAQHLTKGLEEQGLRAVTGGTDTHLALLDLTEIGATGAEAEARCDAAGIVLNKNAIPYDPQPPSVASGIRVGSPSVTTQGMGPAEMTRIADLIGRAIRDVDGINTVEIAAEVGELVSAHPAYPEPSRPH